MTFPDFPDYITEFSGNKRYFLVKTDLGLAALANSQVRIGGIDYICIAATEAKPGFVRLAVKNF